MYEMTMHTSYGDAIPHPYDVNQHNPPLSKERMIVALDEAYNANMNELQNAKLHDLKAAIKAGNVTYLQQRITCAVGYEIKLVNQHKRKFVGRLHRNGRGSLVVVNRKGRTRQFTYKDITHVKWNRMENNMFRMEIGYDEDEM